MNINFVKAAAIAVASTFAFSAAMASAQDDKPRSLDQLLEFVKQGQVTDAKENRAREQAFASNKANQAAELQRVSAERTREEALSAQLEDQFEANELLVVAKQDQLKDKLGTLAELFGHLTAAAGERVAAGVAALRSASRETGRLERGPPTRSRRASRAAGRRAGRTAKGTGRSWRTCAASRCTVSRSSRPGRGSAWR